MSEHDSLGAAEPAVESAPPVPTVPRTMQPVAHRVTRRAAPGAVQAKLTVGSADDRLEREADQIAALVMRQIYDPAAGQQFDADPSNSRIQRTSVPATARDHHPARDTDSPGRIRRSVTTDVGAAGGAVDAATERSIQRARGGGQRLPSDLAATMGRAMAADFGRVRVHTDQRANELNNRIQAKAFTTGSDVFFRDGEYRPTERSGQELLAHELTHVVQQGAAGVQRRHHLRPRHRVSQAPVGKVQRLLSATDLAGLSPASKRSVRYRTMLELMEKYHTDTAALQVGENTAQGSPIVVHPELSAQLTGIENIAKKKVKSRPVLETLITDIRHERLAVNTIKSSGFIEKYAGQSYLQAITATRVMTSPKSKSLYPPIMPALEEDLVDEESEDEQDDVTEEEVEQLSSATPLTRLQQMWQKFQAKVPNLAMFLEGMAGLVVNPLKLTFNIVKGIAKLVFFLVKSTAKMLIEPFVNFAKLFTKTGRADLFTDTKQLHFERRTGKSGMGWATLEGVGLWIGNIRNWAGWISVVSGLIGIIPGAQPALVISAAAGGVNVIAGFAAAAIDGVLIAGRALYDYLSSAPDNSVRNRLLLRFLGDVTAVATATGANVTTNLVGGGGSVDGDVVGKEALAVNDPSAQVDATKSFGSVTDKAAQDSASASVLGGGPGGEALKQGGTYTPTNAIGGEINAAAEMDEKVAALKAKVAAMKKAMMPVYKFVMSVWKVLKGVYGGVKWACEKIVQLFKYLKRVVGAKIEAAKPVVSGAISRAIEGIVDNIAANAEIFQQFNQFNFFANAGVWGG